MRRNLPLAISFIAGLLAIINTITIAPSFNKFFQDYIARSVTLVVNWGVALGSVNLLRIHWTRMARKRDGWINSLALYISYFFMLFLGFYAIWWGKKLGVNDQLYQYFYKAINVPLNSTMFAVLCFYIASAAYRAFRARSVEATLLLISATIVMLGGTPIGKILFNGFGPQGILGFPWLKAWIMEQANTSVVRALTLGITLGGLAQSTRNWLGIERGYMSGD